MGDRYLVPFFINTGGSPNKQTHLCSTRGMKVDYKDRLRQKTSRMIRTFKHNSFCFFDINMKNIFVLKNCTVVVKAEQCCKLYE